MAVAQVDSGLLVSKIAAFCAGFGQPAELCAALRDSTVVVPLVGDDRVLKLPLGGLDWCAHSPELPSGRGTESDSTGRNRACVEGPYYPVLTVRGPHHTV